jgi:hypothetical protein
MIWALMRTQPQPSIWSVYSNISTLLWSCHTDTVLFMRSIFLRTSEISPPFSAPTTINRGNMHVQGDARFSSIECFT